MILGCAIERRTRTGERVAEDARPWERIESMRLISLSSLPRRQKIKGPGSGKRIKGEGTGKDEKVVDGLGQGRVDKQEVKISRAGFRDSDRLCIKLASNFWSGPKMSPGEG